MKISFFINKFSNCSSQNAFLMSGKSVEIVGKEIPKSCYSYSYKFCPIKIHPKALNTDIKNRGVYGQTYETNHEKFTKFP